MKNTLAPGEIEPVTFRFVTQHLNHCGTAVSMQLLQYVVRSKNQEVPHYTVFASLVLTSSSFIQDLLSTLFSNTPSLRICPFLNDSTHQIATVIEGEYFLLPHGLLSVAHNGGS